MPRDPPTELRIPAVAIGFLPEFPDFKRGICVGTLEDHVRIKGIQELAIEGRHGGPFVTERCGRGVYWRCIGYLPHAIPRNALRFT